MITFWLILFILSIIIELLTINLVSIWLSLGALAALIAYLLNAPIFIQIIVAIFITTLTLLLVRPLSKKYLNQKIIPTNLDLLIGKKALVTKDILPDEYGEVKVSNQYWLAKSISDTPIHVNQHVTIERIDGVKLIVKKGED